jgi:hypothetical protein
MTQGDELKPEVMSRAAEAREPPEEVPENPKHRESLPLLVIMGWSILVAK